jgi:type IV secretion system protein VirB10
MIQIGSKVADRTLNIQPTITVNQGTRMNVMINSDLKLTPYRR